MARVPTVWRRKQDRFFYTTIRGTKHKLSRNKREADRLFHALLAAVPDAIPVRPPAVAPDRVTVAEVLDAYLEHVQLTKSATTYAHRRGFLNALPRETKLKPAADLRERDVTAWLLARPTWGHNSRVTAKHVLKACLAWATRKEKLLAVNPLADLEVEPARRRERMLSAEERARIRAAVPAGPFRNFLTFLELTGCRPFSEAARVTADLIDWEAGTITFAGHKNERHGKTRVVYLTPGLTALLKEWCRDTPAGPLFHTKNGIAFDNRNVTTRVRRLERALGIPRFCLYAFRHAYFTEGLANGVPAAVLAEIGGNSPRTLEKYYSHLDQRREVLRAAAVQALGGAGGNTPPA